ncbi:MAG TPA: hypothetical protein VK211_22610, partial [Kamptonema sp.]|nr:hypothetical protein [Kamptonema sp.]
MEPLRRTGTFKKRITSTDANNIVTVLDLSQILAPYKIFEADYFIEASSLIEEFKVTVGLLQLLRAEYPATTALMNDAQKEAAIAKIRDNSQKISLGIYTARGNGPWEYESEAVLLNLGGAENHVPLLVPFLSTNETFLIDADFKLGVKIEAKWQHPLKTGDYLVVKGTYRQTINFLKKNGSDLDELNNRVKTLESLLSIFGGASASQAGTNGLVPAPGVGDNNKLLKGDRNWQSTSATGLALLNAADAAAVRSQLATPGLTGNTFTGPQVITDTTASTNTTTGAHVVAGGVGIAGFTTLGD